MSEEELKVLEKAMKKKKRIASEWASQLHDLVEDRLPAAYSEIPEMAESCYKACQEWEQAKNEFESAKAE